MKKEFKIGDKVTWLCKPYGSKSFTCSGTIDSFKTAAGFKSGASVVVDLANCPDFVNAYPKRKKTCIGLDSLSKLP
jgi:hypothetical protein